MATLADFLQTLFDEGRIVLKGRPIPLESDHAPAAVARLEAAFDVHRLDVAGPPIAFDGSRSALAGGGAGPAVELVPWLIGRRSVETMERFLIWPRPPRTASEHLSADLTFRFLPQIQRRSRSIAPGDRLSSFLANLLRAWPLSGVLSDIQEGPKDVGDLGGHAGLWMLYAERLARDEKLGWMPRRTREGHVELVFRGLGKGRSDLLGPPVEAVESESEGVVRGG